MNMKIKLNIFISIIKTGTAFLGSDINMKGEESEHKAVRNGEFNKEVNCYATNKKKN